MGQGFSGCFSTHNFTLHWNLTEMAVYLECTSNNLCVITLYGEIENKTTDHYQTAYILRTKNCRQNTLACGLKRRPLAASQQFSHSADDSHFHVHQLMLTPTRQWLQVNLWMDSWRMANIEIQSQPNFSGISTGFQKFSADIQSGRIHAVENFAKLWREWIITKIGLQFILQLLT